MNPTDAKMIKFLTQSENVPCVLEIIQHSDEIQMSLLQAFWRRVRDALEKARPKGISEADLRLDFRTPNRQFGGVNGFLTDTNSTGQKLFYTVEHLVWNHGTSIELYFGLHLNRQVKDASALLRIPELARLKTAQEQVGFVFDNDPWWFCWRYLEEQHPRPVEFLVELHSNSESWIQRISDSFWQLVQTTRVAVLEANGILLTKTAKK